MHKRFFRTLFLTMLAGAVTAVGMLGFTACEGGTAGKDGKSAYDIWLEQGNTGTEQDFLDSLKGDKGDQGIQGLPGNPGVDGSGWTLGEVPPVETDGDIGDFWLNSTDWHVWHKEEDGWKDLGSIKAGDEAQPEVVVKDFGEVNLEANVSSKLDIQDVQPGTYFIVAETTSEAKDNNLIVRAGESGNTTKYQDYDMCCRLSTGYKGVVTLASNTELTISCKEAIKVNLKLVEYSLTSVMTAGESFEVPANHSQNGYAFVAIDPALAGKTVKITVQGGAFVVSYSVRTEQGTALGTMTKDSQDKTKFTLQATIPAETTAICIASIVTKRNCNVAVTIEVVE